MQELVPGDTLSYSIENKNKIVTFDVAILSRAHMKAPYQRPELNRSVIGTKKKEKAATHMRYFFQKVCVNF